MNFSISPIWSFLRYLRFPKTPRLPTTQKKGVLVVVYLFTFGSQLPSAQGQNLQLSLQLPVQSLKEAGYAVTSANAPAPLLLNDYYQAAKKNDALFRAAQAERDRKFILAERPTIERSGQGLAEWGVSYNHTFSPFQAQQWIHSGLLTYSWPVWDRELRAKIAQGQALTLAAQAQYVAAEQDLIARVLISYLRLSAAKAKMDTLRQQSQFLATILTSAKARLEVGSASIAEVTEIESEYQTRSTAATQAENEFQFLMYDIRSKSGLDFTTALDLAKSVNLPTPAHPDIFTWAELAKVQNPDVLFKQLETDVARWDIQRAKGMYQAKVFVRASAQYQKSLFGASPGTRNATANIGIFLTIPLTAGLKNSHEKEAVFTLERQLAEWDFIKEQAATSAMQAFTQLNTAISNAKTQLFIVNQQQRLVRQLGRDYQQGAANYVDLLRANNTLSQQSSLLQETKYQGFIAWIELKSKVGNLSEDDVAYLNSLYLNL